MVITTVPFRVASISVENLWGIRDINLSFNPDVNILIGPNACGKTTVLDLLRQCLTVDIGALSRLPCDKVTISLSEFEGTKKRKLSVERTNQNVKLRISNRVYEISGKLARRAVHYRHVDRRYWQRELDFHAGWHEEVREELSSLVPAVWLPVSRRLPVPLEQDVPQQGRKLESVDHRLTELLAELERYRLGLDAKMATEYKLFERRVLTMMLYNKAHDTPGTMRLEELTDDDKKLLISSFDAAGLITSAVRRRIDEHFQVANDTIRRIQAQSRIDLVDAFVMPLIPRTSSMVEAARSLESSREAHFSPLTKFERIASSFLTEKSIKVTEKGVLLIAFKANAEILISPHRLSSGEKQILILLIQALLWEDRPVVYVADEPELSLHVIWQEKLLASLVELAGKIQIIVATHSPDIIGPFRHKVLDLGKQS